MPEFTYDKYRDLLSIAQERFEIRPLGAAGWERGQKPVLLLRHDVDVSLEKAVVMAAIEAKMGVPSTYLLMTDSLLYGSLASEDNLGWLFWLEGMGREIGLHVWVKSVSELEGRVESGRALLRGNTGEPVRSVSFHRPLAGLLGGDLTVCGLINAYSGKLLQCYASDSAGRWRCGDPVEFLRTADCEIVQLLVHPVWWGDVHMEPEFRLKVLVDRMTEGKTEEEMETVLAAVAEVVPAVWQVG